jgi:hypothetical protein
MQYWTFNNQKNPGNKWANNLIRHHTKEDNTDGN